MFVRLLIALALIVGPGSHASADQQPTFVLTVKATGKKPGQQPQLAVVEAALHARENALKTALLAKTKAHPASRLAVKARVRVAGKGLVRATAVEVSYRNGSGPIVDDSIRTTVEQVIDATPRLTKAIGIEADLVISVLQP